MLSLCVVFAQHFTTAVDTQWLEMNHFTSSFDNTGDVDQFLNAKPSMIRMGYFVMKSRHPNIAITKHEVFNLHRFFTHKDLSARKHVEATQMTLRQAVHFILNNVVVFETFKLHATRDHFIADIKHRGEDFVLKCANVCALRKR